MTRSQLYLGLLLALRAHRATFIADGSKFHEAFGKVHALAVSKYADRLPWLVTSYRDPMFGSWHVASDMLLEGMSGVLLFFSSDWTRAHIRLSPVAAMNELEEYGDDVALLQDLALTFHNALPRE